MGVCEGTRVDFCDGCVRNIVRVCKSVWGREYSGLGFEVVVLR